jgi:ketosteroid isomerase-like protein
MNMSVERLSRGTGSLTGVHRDRQLRDLARGPRGRSQARDTARAMSQENVEVVRGVPTRLTVSSKTRRRSVYERILVRFPVFFRVLASAWWRLPPRSRLRRALTARNFRQAYEAANRRDFDVLLLRLDPEIEFQFDESPVGGMLPPDLVGVHRGHEGYVRVWEAGLEAADNYRLEPEEVIDFGDRLLVVGRQTGRGTSSGIPFDEPLLSLFTLRRGLVVRLKDFATRDKALEAAGVRE